MKKILLTCCVALLACNLFAQQNAFLDRSFWKKQPSVNDVKAKIKEGDDPLEFNASHFNGIANSILANAPAETIEYLLSLDNVDLDLRTHDGRTYLIWASYAGNYPIVKYLVDQGANVDMKGTHGFGAITFAAYAGVDDTRIYDYLINNGLSVEQETKAGATAILLIMQRAKNASIIDYFAEKGLNIHSKDHEGNGAFNYAAKGGNLDIMNYLIEKGVDYKSKNKLGGNAVLAASEGLRGKTPTLETFEFLTRNGVVANVVDEKGDTPLILLARNNKDLKLFKFFLEKEVDVNTVNAEGNNALINASRGNSLEIVKFLEKHTKNINHQNNQGESALMMAVKNNSEEVVSFLLDNEAKTDLQDKEGNNLIYYWANSGGRARNGKTAPLNLKKLDLLKQKGLNVVSAQPNGNTLLHVAAQNNNLQLVKKAIEWGVPLNAKNQEGNTALLIAALNAKNQKILKYLVENGADKTITTEFEESAYDLAKENEVLSENIESLKFLK